MTDSVPNDGLQLRSLAKESGEIELSLVRVPTPGPAADEVVVRVEATPINPSDIGLLFGAATVALPLDNDVWVGTYQGNRIARFPLASMR